MLTQYSFSPYTPSAGREEFVKACKTDVSAESAAAAIEKGGENVFKKFLSRFGFAGSVGALGVAEGIELTKKVGSGIQHFRSHHSASVSGEETKTGDAKSGSDSDATSQDDGGGETKEDGKATVAKATLAQQQQQQKLDELKEYMTADRFAVLHAIYTP